MDPASLNPAYNDLNRAERERLAAVVGRLSDEDLARPLSDGWTVGVALAHIAFWDRLGLAQLRRWEQDGTISTRPMESQLINDACLADWLALPPAAIRREVVQAAEAVDHKVAGLSPDLVRLIAAERPRTLQRFNHRRGHLDEIEAALRA